MGSITSKSFPWDATEKKMEKKKPTSDEIGARISPPMKYCSQKFSEDN
jgi:hypothetical protein